MLLIHTQVLGLAVSANPPYIAGGKTDTDLKDSGDHGVLGRCSSSILLI